MKLLSLTSAFLMGALSVGAQTMVDTTVNNKNVVLEEFTGIKCGFCPDGHKKANDLSAANPGRILAINIHAGGYASPNSNQKDFRTSEGSAIASRSGLRGYPAGQLNRRIFAGETTRATSRFDWATYAGIVMGEVSPVNVAAKATFTESTREVQVVVETYYTADSDKSEQRLHIAMIQDSIMEFQSGASYNPSQILNARYVHMHALRKFLTEENGVKIKNTTKGSFSQDTFYYTVPAQIVNIPATLKHMHFVAFVADGIENVTTGAQATNAFIAGTTGTTVSVDAAVKAAHTVPATAGYCSATLVPKVMVYNNGTTAMSSFRADYNINGGGMHSKTVNTALAAGDSVLVVFPPITLDGGANRVEYSIQPALGNNTQAESDATNNKDAMDAQAVLGNVNNRLTTVLEDFESYSEAELNWNNTARLAVGDINSGVATAGAYATSSNSFKWDFHQQTVTGGSSSYIFDQIDMSTSTGNTLLFDYAKFHALFYDNDKLTFDISTDCGVTWTSLWEKSGTDLATKNNFNPVAPTAADWKTDSVDLSAYDGQSAVTIRVTGTSGGGNDLYLDNVQVKNSLTNTAGTNTRQVAGVQASMELFPNPASTILNVAVRADMNVSATFTVYNALGQAVKTVNNVLLSTAGETVELSTADLNTGIYFLQVNANGKTLAAKQFAVRR
jgi:hypothetical protein